MDLIKKNRFMDENKNNEWCDKCNSCCVVKCGLFGDFENKCHCENFSSKSCKGCKHKDLTF